MRLPPSVHHTHQLHHTPQTAMEVTGHAGVDSGMTALGDQSTPTIHFFITSVQLVPVTGSRQSFICMPDENVCLTKPEWMKMLQCSDKNCCRA